MLHRPLQYVLDCIWDWHDGGYDGGHGVLGGGDFLGVSLGGGGNLSQKEYLFTMARFHFFAELAS